MPIRIDTVALYRARIARGLTQADLAEKVGVSRVHMGRIENGLRNPTERILKRAARALGVRMSDLGYEFVPRRLPEKRDGTDEGFGAAP